MKDQTSQEFHRKCTKCGPLKNSKFRKYQWKSKLLKIFTRNVLSVDLRKNPTLGKYRWKSKLLKGFIKIVLSVDLWKIPTLGKYRWKSKLLKSFIENVLSVDLWEIPHLVNIDEEETSQEFFQKWTKYRPLKNSILGKYRWKIKLLKSFIEIH